MGINRGTKIKARLAEQALTSHWLMLRIFEDCGVSVEKTRLSQILGGVNPDGPVSSEVMDCAEKVLDRYEGFYKKEAE